MNLKALALRVLQGNQQGNPEETKSFLGGQKEEQKFPSKFPSTDATKWQGATGEISLFCTGDTCRRHEIINLPRRGRTPGCIIRGIDMETWRPLHMMTGCPLDN